MNVSDQDSLRLAISRVDSDLRDDVIAAVHTLSHTPLPSVFPDVGAGDVVSQISSSGNSVGGVGGLQLHGMEYYPESFKVFQEDPGGGYVCRNPIVVTPDGEVGVENSDTLSPGSTWYCVVRKDKDGKWSASMVTEGGVSSARQSGDRVFYSVKIAEIAPGSNGGYVYQYHTGAIVVGDPPVPVDDVSVEDHSDDNEGDLRYAVKGWHDQDASESKLGDLLTGDEEDTSRQILVRNGKGGATEFLSIGKVAAAKDGKLSVKFGTDAAVQKFSANTDQDATLEFAKVADTGSYYDLKDKPTIPAAAKDGKLSVKFGTDAAVQKFSANTDQDATLEFAKVADTGSYNDLKDKPTIPQPIQPNDGRLKVQFGTDAAAVQKFSANQQGDSTLSLAKVADTGSYNDLKDKPTIPTALQGSDYIDVPTTGTDTGKVKAKVPTDGTKGLVTTDLDQQVSGNKSFTNTLKVGTAPNQSEYASSHIYLKAASGDPWITFFNASYENVALLQWSPTNNRFQIVAKNGIYLGGNADTVTLEESPTSSVNETDTSKKLAVATCGWVNGKYKVTELVEGDNITITPDATNPKKLTIAATGGAKLDHSFSWEGVKKADIASSADIAVDSKTIKGIGGIDVTEKDRVITISGSGSQVAGYTTPSGTYDYEVTGLEWNTTKHRIVIHKVKKTYENGLLKTRESVTDEYIQFVEETV